MSPAGSSHVGVVTGGASAIGAAATRALLELGYEVILVGRSSERLETARSGYPESVRTFAMDVTEGEDWARLTDATSVWGTVRALVCVAGVAVRAPFIDSDPLDWDAMWRTNVVGALLGVRSVLPMMRGDGGRIILVSSAGARIGLEDRAVYSATKGALEAFVRSLAVEVAGSGITVNAIAPGAMPTESSQAWLSANPGIEKATLAEIPEGRFGKAPELQPAFRFLLSSPYSQGSTVTVDGGWSI
jgi:NAD(P)-dependent dehydrogenase (short-subunit alcohol dehydrogenase family)